MPLYEVVLEQRYNNQQVINRWNYLGSGTPAAVTPSFALLKALGFIGIATTLGTGTVGNAIQQVQNPQVTFVQATARAVFVDADFYDNPFLAGTIGLNGAGGNPLYSEAAFGFRSNRVKQSIGRGYKRFVGISEAMLDDYSVLNSTAQANLTVLATAMSAVVTYDDEGNTLSFSPCIAQKFMYTVPPAKPAYKYYADEGAQAPHLAVGITWQFYQAATTQNSRKVGRGS